MRELNLPPSAASLSASLRDIGYTLETAIADLVDNSIAAGAHTIDVYCDPGSVSPALAVIDDGCGMSGNEIVDAMRLGGSSRAQERSVHDLGKFGLGLKTASFSQCRCLTVVSRKDGRLSGIEWDLDVVKSSDRWIVRELDSSQLRELPYAETLTATGTLILWRKLDRLFGGLHGRSRQEVAAEKLVALEKHLGLVFHRFLAGTVSWHKPFGISVNGHPVADFDPFCREHPATIKEPEESVQVGRSRVTLAPFILPHHSKLKAHVLKRYKDRSDFVANQGVYVYRNCRLIAWGGWFRIMARSEVTKLARIQVDFSSALDGSWTIDIKKSSAIPPKAVRDQLRLIIDRIADRSTAVIKDKGRRALPTVKYTVWERLPGKAGIRYAISATHPLVKALEDALDEGGLSKLRLLLDTAAAALPVETIYADHAVQPRRTGVALEHNGALLEKVKQLRACLPEQKRSDQTAVLALAKQTRLFDRDWPAVEEIVRGLQ